MAINSITFPIFQIQPIISCRCTPHILFRNSNQTSWCRHHPDQLSLSLSFIIHHITISVSFPTRIRIIWLKSLNLKLSYFTQDLVISKVQYRRPRETHDSSFCLNGLPSAQQISVNMKLNVITGLVRGIHRSPMNSPHKWPVTQKVLPFDYYVHSNRRQFKD